MRPTAELRKLCRRRRGAAICALWALLGCAGEGPQRQVEEIAEGTGALAGPNLSGTNLSGANLGGVNLGGTNLGGVNLGGTNLGGNNLGGVNLGGTNLGGNNLGGNNLGGTNLGGVNLGGVNLGGVNLGGTNLGGTNLSGSNLAGNYVGLGCPVDGTQNLLNTDLMQETVATDIHNLGLDPEDQMLWSGEEAFARTSSCVVVGIGSTAMAKLVNQNNTDMTINAALKQLPWGFAPAPNEAVTLNAWEVVVWGSTSYSVFILAVPSGVSFEGVAGFIKAVWRWTAPPSKTINIGQIGGGKPVATYPGMMDAGTRLINGEVSEKAYIAGELALVTATTNNQSITVDFSSWVRKIDGTGLILGNVETPSGPTHGESVYRAMEEPDGTIRIAIGPLSLVGGSTYSVLAGGPTDSMNELEHAYQDWQSGVSTEKPAPSRCAGALLLNSLNNAESDWENKCDSGVAWSPHTPGAPGQTTWSAVGGTVTPYNDYMTIQATGARVYKVCRPGDIDISTNSCPLSSRLPVISETFIHQWEAAFTDSTPKMPVQLSLGSYFTCARRSDGTLWCWGNNVFGQLGNSSGYQLANPSMQVKSNGTPFTDVVDVAASWNSACARKADGTLWCWGRNNSGQLGIGTTDALPHPDPVQVTALGNEVAEASGNFQHTCARKTDGTVWCWGLNDFGQVGTGTMGGIFPNPVQVSALGSDVVQISAGRYFTCARKANGTLWCWGKNEYGQVGNGTASDTPTLTPVQVSALGSDVAQVSAGFFHACARKTNGTAWCWGYNLDGPLGDGTMNHRSFPQEVVGLGGNVAEIASAWRHTCARKTDGTLWCWGANNSGQIGDGTNTRRLTPVQVTAVGTGVVEVAACNEHTCVRMSNATVRCFGLNSDGQLGSGIWSYSAPVKLASLGKNVRQGAITYGHGLARMNDGTVRMWGYWETLGDPNTKVNTPSPVPVVMGDGTALDNVTEVVAGRFHSCALKNDGTVWCWGTANAGQLGDIGLLNQYLPLQVSALGNSAVEIASSYYFSCARKNDGKVMCWGQSANGQMGNGTNPPTSNPVEVSGLTGATDIAAGSLHACARTSDGALWCWGGNNFGQLGDGTTTQRNTPVQVSALGTDVASVETGESHTCARKIDGTMWCWGRNDSAQLGDGTTTSPKTTPVQVTALGNRVAQVAPASAHTCARKTDGTVWCWGHNYYGQVGNGTKTTTLVTSPVKVATSVAHVAAGRYQTCIRKTEGSLWCWGHNPFGTLGIGVWADSNTPQNALAW